jgi:hypothetical protein
MAHKIEIAPSGRASCRGCRQPIAKGDCRFAEEYRNQFSEEGGMSFRYWHLPCAATKLANELAAALAVYDGPVVDRSAIEAAIAEHERPTMPYAERAGSGRARCRACDENIAKGELRVAFERSYETPTGPQQMAAYAHARCLPRYLARQKDRGHEVPALDELLQFVRAHSKLTEDDLAAVESAARAPT